MIDQLTASGAFDFFSTSTWTIVRNLAILLVAVFWLAVAVWVYKDGRRRIEDQRASGQSVRAWCLASGTREHSFYFWRKRLSPSASSPGPRRASNASSPVALARVNLLEPGTLDPLRLRLAGGRELILPASMPMSRLAELIVALEAGGQVSTQRA